MTGHCEECGGVGGCGESPVVAGVDLPDGTRVRVTVEGKLGTLPEDGTRYFEFTGDQLFGEWLPLAEVADVVAVPVVPEPGKWWTARSEPWWWSFVGPDGDVWLVNYPRDIICPWQDVTLPLVECEAPAEFQAKP